MKIINLKIAILEENDIDDSVKETKPLMSLTKDDLTVDISEEFDLILYEGAYKHHPEKWKSEKDELIQDIQKMTSTDNSYFMYMKNLNKKLYIKKFNKFK